MKNKKIGVVLIIGIMMITGAVILGVNYIAVNYCMDHLNLFTAMVLVVPMVCVAVGGFLAGLCMEWNWKKGIIIGLAFTLISFGTGRLMTAMAGSSLDFQVAEQQSDDMNEQMEELYNELDQKAYEYMLQQGLISEGDEIYGGEGVVNAGQFEENDTVNNEESEELYSETYMGVSKADPVTGPVSRFSTK